MALKGKYESIDNQSFDIDSLKAGEIRVVPISFAERHLEAKNMDVIEIGYEIEDAKDEENKEHIGKRFTSALFFGENSAITIRQVKTFLKGAGFDVMNWTKDNQMPMSQMLPSALKLLVWKMVPCLGKVSKRR